MMSDFSGYFQIAKTRFMMASSLMMCLVVSMVISNAVCNVSIKVIVLNPQFDLMLHSLKVNSGCRNCSRMMRAFCFLFFILEHPAWRFRWVLAAAESRKFNRFERQYFIVLQRFYQGWETRLQFFTWMASKHSWRYNNDNCQARS